MKKFLLILVTLFLMPKIADASTWIDGLYYDLDSSSMTANVTSKNYWDDYVTGNIVIPEIVTYEGKTYSVTSIGYQAFAYCSGLTSVEIPNSVTSIGYEAFFCCSGLSSVEIPNSVTSIGNSAFSGCSGMTSVTISNSVTSLGDWVFFNCRGLSSVEIPNSITSIGENAFYGCSGLTSVEIPNSVNEIGGYAFCNCSGLSSVEIGNSVISIGNYAFSGCGGLPHVTIPNSVVEIGKEAFYGCAELTALYIGEKVKLIGEKAFASNQLLEEIVVAPMVPPTAPQNIFSDFTYTYANPFVPERTINSYKALAPWKNFFNINNAEESGVEEVGTEATEVLYDVFYLNGQLVKRQASQSDIDALAPGIYIVGGKKVIVK